MKETIINISIPARQVICCNIIKKYKMLYIKIVDDCWKTIVYYFYYIIFCLFERLDKYYIAT